MKQTSCVLFGFMFNSCRTRLFERIALLRRIWQVRLTFCARYQDLHLVPCKCQQKHMWPVLGLWVWGCLNTHTGLSLYDLWSLCIWKYSAIQNMARNMELIQPPAKGLACWSNLPGGTAEHHIGGLWVPWQPWAWRHWSTGTIRYPGWFRLNGNWRSSFCSTFHKHHAS